MQRSRFNRPRIAPKEEAGHPPSHQVWQNQPVGANNYGGIKLYNPNEMDQPNYNSNQNFHPGQPQNVWPNGDQQEGLVPSYQVEKPIQRDLFNGSQGLSDGIPYSHAPPINWGSTTPATLEQHNNAGWTPVYPETQHETQNSSNSTYPQLSATDATVYHNYNDVWNWGKEDDSGSSNANTPNPEITMASTTYDKEPQADIVAENVDDQLNEHYQRWNLAQHFQYDWSQTQQSEVASNLSTLPTTLDQNSHIQWGNVPQAELNSSSSTNWISDSHHQNVDSNTRSAIDNASSDAVASDVYTGDAAQVRSSVRELDAGLCAADDLGSVSAYFHHDDDDEEVQKLTLHDYSPDKKQDEVSSNHLSPSKALGTELPAEPHTGHPWPSYLRVDSWMSNSSLVTYNRSYTGSQEFLLSGSLYGGEDGALGIASHAAVSDLSQAVDEMHISAHPTRRSEMTHPLHKSYSAREGFEENSDHDQCVNEECKNDEISKDAECEPLNATNVVTDDGRTASNNVETNLEVIPPTHSDNVEVLDNSCLSTDEQVEETKDNELGTENATESWSQDDVTNEEVPSFDRKDSFKFSVDPAIAQNVNNTENVEVIEKRISNPDIHQPVVESVLATSSRPRENSAFQPPIISAVRTSISSPVIQREILDDVPTRDNIPKSKGSKIAHDAESANLEMVPDNAERPLDSDVGQSDKKVAPRSSRLAAHTSTARQRQTDHKVPSPGTTLWDSPDLAGTVGAVLAPPAKGSHIKGPTQSALVVPKLTSQPEASENSPTATLVQQLPQFNQPVDNSGQRQMAVGGANEGLSVSTNAASPLDLSSRAAPQGRSFIDDEVQRRRRSESTSVNRDLSDQDQPALLPSSSSSRNMDLDGQANPVSYPSNIAEADNGRQWRQGSRSDYWRDSERDWDERNRDERNRSSRNWEDDYNRRGSVSHGGGVGGGGGHGYGGRRDEGGPPSDMRDPYGQTQLRRESRDWDRDNPQQPVDPYSRRAYPRPERDRSRPSSRASNQDYDSDRYYDRRDMYTSSGDVRGHPPRPSSRSGYESDHGSERQQRYDPSYPQYNYYQRDPQYAAYNDYMRYQGNPYGDPRQYPNPYYGMSHYDYGYYAELYGNDPRYRAYYDSVAKGYYWQQQQYQQRYDEYDRHSVHSGRSSVTDDSRNSQIRRDSKDFSAELGGNSSNDSQQLPANQVNQSAMAYDDSYLSQNSLSEFTDQISAGVDILAKQRLTPAKFSIPHVRATFNPSGKLALIIPNSIMDGQPAQVEICERLCAQESDEIAQEFNNFPGPLIRGDTHKNDVIQFCLQKIRKAKADFSLPDRDSCILIWELLVLLVRQNGVVVGTDIAELLLKDRCLVEPELDPTIANTTNDGILLNDTLDNPVALADHHSQDANKFLEFLLYGHKKDALEWAMKRGIWGHALFLASKMDTRTYAMVMTRFANSLKFNDPLQTLYQLMSGRQPASVTSIADEKWGDWRPHLAIILSNSTQRPELDRRSVVTLGDTLAAKGCLHAAHFCYLMAQLDFGSYAKKASKLVLIGANHSMPFSQFAIEEAIQCTEIYEYVQSLANPQFILPHLQFYKFLYAIRLLDAGYPQKALHYCEVVASSIRKWPHLFDSDLARQTYELAYRLKYYDPHYMQEEGEMSDIVDPVWLKELWNVVHTYNSGEIRPSSPEYSEQMLANDSADISATSDAYRMETSPLNESSAYQHQQYTYASNVASDNNAHSQAGYQNANQQPLNNFANTASQQGGSGFAKQEEYTYQNSAVQQQDDYQAVTSSYNYDNYYGVSTSNVNQHSESRTDPEIDYYGASMQNNAISSVNASSTPKTSEHRILRRTSSSGSAVPPPTPSHSAAASFANKDKSVSENKAKQLPSKSSESKDKPKQGGSWLGGIFTFLRGKNQMILPDDKNPKIVWDPKSGRWVNMEGDEEEEENPALAAPPKDLEVQQEPARNAPVATLSSYDSGKPMTNHAVSHPPPPAASTSNRYKLRAGRGMRNNYVDVLSDNVIPVQSNVSSLTSLNPIAAGGGNVNYPVQFLVPVPVAGEENAPVDYVTTSAIPTTGNEVNDTSEQPVGINAPLNNHPNLEQSDNDQPLMYNPNMMRAGGNPNLSTGLQRYGRRPR